MARALLREQRVRVRDVVVTELDDAAAAELGAREQAAVAELVEHDEVRRADERGNHADVREIAAAEHDRVFACPSGPRACARARRTADGCRSRAARSPRRRRSGASPRRSPRSPRDAARGRGSRCRRTRRARGRPARRRSRSCVRWSRGGGAAGAARVRRASRPRRRRATDERRSRRRAVVVGPSGGRRLVVERVAQRGGARLGMPAFSPTRRAVSNRVAARQCAVSARRRRLAVAGLAARGLVLPGRPSPPAPRAPPRARRRCRRARRT